MSDMTVKQLKEVATQKGVTFTSKTKKEELITAIEDASKSKTKKLESKPTIRKGGEY